MNNGIVESTVLWAKNNYWHIVNIILANRQYIFNMPNHLINRIVKRLTFYL